MFLCVILNKFDIIILFYLFVKKLFTLKMHYGIILV